MAKPKVALALSGGVDSAVSAYLLQKQGYEVVALFFRLSDNYAEAEDKARLIAGSLGLKFFPVNLKAKFDQTVIKYFLEEYQSGRTPNPCVLCNKAIKFKELDRLRRELGADYMATGHYAQVDKADSGGTPRPANASYLLRRGKDRSKDQSYFLYKLKQEDLRPLLFPLGQMVKSEVKEIARSVGLAGGSGESQDICFLASEGKNINHNEFLRQHLPLRPGPILDINSGRQIGEHKGLPLYTIGQRRGVEIGGTGPYYVVGKDGSANILSVTDRPDDPALYACEFKLEQANWISGQEPDLRKGYQALIRYRHPLVSCQISKISESEYLIKLEKPQRAVTSGQSAVFYENDELIGGGTIIQI